MKESIVAATSGVEPDFVLKVVAPLSLIRAERDGVAIKSALASRTARQKNNNIINIKTSPPSQVRRKINLVH